MPLKFKCFNGLFLENKIMMWENYFKWGGTRPNICVLCGRGEEIVYHVMVGSAFTKKFWKEY
jgi:hypothetical protein